VVEIGADQVAAPAASAGRAWAQVYDLADPACAPLLDACRARGLPAPQVGHDIVDGRGRVVATAELAWPDDRVAVFLPGQESDLLLAGQAGWRTAILEANGEDAAMRRLTEAVLHFHASYMP
jgi:DEAD/DEAH box helicase domain-containing protein